MTSNNNLEAACTALTEAVTQLTAVLRNRNEACPAFDHSERAEEVEEEGASAIWRTQVEQACSQALDAAAFERRLYVYMAGARGLANLTRAHGREIVTSLGLAMEPYIVKCGTTTVPLEARLRQIGQDRYGAAVRTKNGIIAEPGFTRWIAHAIAAARQPRDPAVTLLPRAVAIDLPAGFTRRAFDGALHRALQTRALDGLPASVMGKRYVAYDLIETRLSAAKEFYALSPHNPEDGDLLLDAVEDILRRFRAEKA